MSFVNKQERGLADVGLIVKAPEVILKAICRDPEHY